MAALTGVPSKSGKSFDVGGAVPGKSGKSFDAGGGSRDPSLWEVPGTSGKFSDGDIGMSGEP